MISSAGSIQFASVTVLRSCPYYKRTNMLLQISRYCKVIYLLYQSIKWFISDNKGPYLLYRQTDRQTEKQTERQTETQC